MEGGKIKELAERVYREYIFGGTGRPTYGVDFDREDIIEALEMMVHLKECADGNHEIGAEGNCCKYCGERYVHGDDV